MASSSSSHPFAPAPLIRNLLLSGSCSVIILSLMFSLLAKGGGEIGFSTLWTSIRSISLMGLAVYTLFEFLQAAFRAARYRLLLDAGGSAQVPPFRHLYLVTVARNMLVDLFPGRAGELGYVALLKRGYDVDSEQGLSSLAVSILLDVVALAVVVFLFMAPTLIELAGWGGYLLGTLLVLVILAIGWVGWFRIFPAVMDSEFYRNLLNRLPLLKRPGAFFEKLSASAEEIRASGRWPALFLWSGLVRVGKYAGLYLLFQTVTHGMWPELKEMSPWAILLVLILAEGAAALPVPAFMSFGPYEAGGTAALAAMGFDPAQSAMTMLVVHLVSQFVGYLLGGGAILLYIYLAPRRPDRVRATAAPQESISMITTFRRWSFPVLMSLIALGVAANTARSFLKLGALTPPGSGTALDLPPEQAERIRTRLQEAEGFLVWSSNRHGSHDILRLRMPELRVDRLTSSEHTDTYPRISPDGTRMVFCRSRVPWVSQRNPAQWDLMLFDFRTGEETRLTEFGYQPAWSPDGSFVVFVRNGDQVVRKDLATGEEKTLLVSGREGVPDGLEFQTPSISKTGQIAVTLRGRRRAAVLMEPGSDAVPEISSKGCQLTWSPDGTFLYWVDHGGPSGLQFHRAASAGDPARVWLDVPGDYSHQYFPHLDRSGQWLALAASTGGHEHDTADYEIHLWNVNTDPSETLRISFHTGNDCWPDVFVNP